MPKSRRNKPRKKAATIIKAPQAAKGHPRLGTMMQWTLGVSTILGCALSLLILVPRPVVEPDGPYDPSRMSQTAFKIANTGIIPLWNIQARLGICKLWAGPQPQTAHCM
jgi:hypothetical protein